MVLLPSSKKKYGDEISISSNDDFSINSTSSNPSIGANISDTAHEIMGFNVARLGALDYR
ncbi:4023_t:CDS:2, partial [Entrophospora sp. SA101]